jgi:hypothetical protein
VPRIETKHDTTTSCSCYEPKIQRERNAPHALLFVVGFAIRNTHPQTTRVIIKEKGKKKERK